MIIGSPISHGEYRKTKGDNDEAALHRQAAPRSLMSMAPQNGTSVAP
jgi:hypothetical protein